MAQNKKHEFAADEVVLADIAKALSHPARIAILKEIAKHDTCICGEIVEVLPLAQSTVSRHLKELLGAGVLSGSIDGTKSCYCINWKVFGKFEKTFAEFFSHAKSFETKRNCC